MGLLLTYSEKKDVKSMCNILLLSGLSLNLLATVLLFFGTKHFPWGMQTIGGKTEKELQFFKIRQKLSCVGFLLLFLGFLLQLIRVFLA